MWTSGHVLMTNSRFCNFSLNISMHPPSPLVWPCTMTFQCEFFSHFFIWILVYIKWEKTLHPIECSLLYFLVSLMEQTTYILLMLQSCPDIYWPVFSGGAALHWERRRLGLKVWMIMLQANPIMIKTSYKKTRGILSNKKTTKQKMSCLGFLCQYRAMVKMH